MSGTAAAQGRLAALRRRPPVPGIVLTVLAVIFLVLGIMYLAAGSSLPGFLTAGTSRIGQGSHVLRGALSLIVAAALLVFAWPHWQARIRAAAGAGWPAVSAGRKTANLWYWAACLLALALVVGPALWLVGGVLVHAVPHWKWSVLSTDTQGETGGLKQAILGTLLITLGVLIIGGTISILTGLYLAEFATGRLRAILRGGYEILSGIPSVVLGLVGYLVLVSINGGLGWKYGLLPAVLVLSVIVIPYITKATETSLLQVPAPYREGAEALGMSPSWTLRKIVFKAALPGIVTGLLVAIAISVGETAPLLYTAGWSDFTPTLQLTGQPIAFLTYPVFTFYNLPVEGAKILSYDAGLLLLVFVLVIIIIGRVIVAWSRRHAE